MADAPKVAIPTPPKGPVMPETNVDSRAALPGRAKEEHRRPLKQGESFRPKGSLTSWSAR